MVAPRALVAEPAAMQETLMAVALWVRGEAGVMNETIAHPAGANLFRFSRRWRVGNLRAVASCMIKLGAISVGMDE